MIWERIKPIGKGLLLVIKRVVLIIGSLSLFWWLGFKGATGLIIGTGLMSYLLLSKNQTVLWLVNLFDSGDYIDMVAGRYKDTKTLKEFKRKKSEEDAINKGFKKARKRTDKD